MTTDNHDSHGRLTEVRAANSETPVSTSSSTSTAAATDRATDGGRGPTASDDAVGPPSTATHTHWLWGVVPAALTIVGFLVGTIAGFEYFIPAASPLGVTATYALLVPYYLIGLGGTLWLYHDAIHVIYGDGTWRPNPYWYIVGGAVVIDLYFLATLPLAEYSVSTVVLYLAGRFLAVLPIASVVAGPLYVLNRDRYLAFDAGAD